MYPGSATQPRPGQQVVCRVKVAVLRQSRTRHVEAVHFLQDSNVQISIWTTRQSERSPSALQVAQEAVL